MKYEYEFEVVPLSEQQQHLIEVGMADLNTLNQQILEVINRRGQDGWEALYPFSMPSIWFRRAKNTRKKIED